MFFLFLSGIDEPIVNLTINRPDFRCSVGLDCELKSIPGGHCCDRFCTNKNWDYHNSFINSLMMNVFALSCSREPIACDCVNNRCESVSIWDITDPETCEKFKNEYEKQICHNEVLKNQNNH
jgi:hypothetical protein